ncbi:MAG: OmpA family protein [Azonexaceae bacterium]|nr:OmpA family protein [Azonexaceae bacterium]
MRKLSMGLFMFCSMLLLGCQSTPETRRGLNEAQIAALKQQGFVESDEGWEFSASEKLLFGSNESVLTPEARLAVGKISALLTKLEIPSVRVDGHTDATGSVAHNEQLSLKRAQAVADVLIASGLPAAGVKVRGVGSRAPVASNQSIEGRMQNRRVVLVIPGG